MINNYVDITVRLLENILDNEADYVKEAGAKVAKSIENDGVIHLFGQGSLAYFNRGSILPGRWTCRDSSDFT